MRQRDDQELTKYPEASSNDIRSHVALMQQNANHFIELLRARNADQSDIFQATLIQQQMNFFASKYPASVPQCPSSLELPVYSVNNDPAAAVTTIDDLLTVPQRLRKKTNRSYKKKNFGVMTSKAVIEEYKKDSERIRQEEVEKAKRKTEREERKIMKQTLINMKKEKSVINKSKEPKPKGRPKKTVVTE